MFNQNKRKLCMKTKLESCKINLGCGRSAIVTIEENCYVKVEFSNNNDGMTPIDLSKHPEMIMKAFSEIKKIYPDYEPKCLLYQASYWVMYHFKRIL